MKIKDVIKLTLIFSGLFFLLTVNGCFVQYISSSDNSNSSTEKTNEKIGKDNKLMEFDNLCKTILVPNGYKLKGKDFGKKSKRIEYFYSSIAGEKIIYENLRSFYIEYLKKENWILITDRDFGSK
jgi:hypothetical protein